MELRNDALLLLFFIFPLSTARFIDRDDTWIPRLTKDDLKSYSLVSRIPLTSLLKFNFYRDVSILYYSMPQDVQEAQFFFKAHEDKISTLGGKCEPQDIDLHLKSGGFPVVNPQNVSFPEDFIDGELRNGIESMKIQSNNSNNSIIISNPVPGDWFGLAFVSWTDPRTDKIEQQGIATVCDTVLYTDLRVLKAPVTIVSTNQNLELLLKNTTENTNDIYKFFNDQEVSSYALNLSVISLCDLCNTARISIQARSIPDEDNYLISCYIDLKKSDMRNLTINFNSYPTEWHYLKISYSHNSLPNSDMKRCIGSDESSDSLASNLTESIVNLVRDTKSEYFTFEYNLPPHPEFTPSLFNVTSGNITSLRFNVFPVQDIGGTLSVGVSLKLDIKYYKGYRRKRNNESEVYFAETDPFIKLVVCLSQNKRTQPSLDGKCEFNGKQKPANMIVNNTGVSSSSMLVHIPYPEVGVWYVTFGLYCDAQTVCPCPVTRENNVTRYLVRNNNEEDAKDNYRIGNSKCQTGVIFSISSSPCIEGKCGRNGVCNYYMSGGFIYSSCRCRSGYTGWDCTDATYATPASEILMSVLFLTLSNLLFLPSIYFAIRRKYYTETVVYFSTMFFSTFYHACDVGDPNYSLCIVRLGVLQYCDFFCGLLSFWVTLVAMAALDNTQVSILHMVGAIIIAFGTELNKQALLVFLIPVAIGVCIVITAWGIRCRRTKKLFPARSYLIVYLPIGLILSAIGLVSFAFLQTNANYHIVHSIWHMVIAMSILCFLPNRAIFFPKS